MVLREALKALLDHRGLQIVSSSKWDVLQSSQTLKFVIIGVLLPKDRTCMKSSHSSGLSPCLLRNTKILDVNILLISREFFNNYTFICHYVCVHVYVCVNFCAKCLLTSFIRPTLKPCKNSLCGELVHIESFRCILLNLRLRLNPT